MTPLTGPTAPSGSSLQHQSEPLAARTGAAAAQAVSGKAETARAVDPPPAVQREVAVLLERERQMLLPPDPNAPAGPPPTFEANVLDRTREETTLKALADRVAAETREATETRIADVAPLPSEDEGTGEVIAFPGAPEASDRADRDATGRNPYDVPPSATERVEGELSLLRGLLAPKVQGQLDLAR